MWFSIWFLVFIKNSNEFSIFFLVFLRSEGQLSASTDLEQLQNANVIERNAWQTKCQENNFSWLNILGIHRSYVSNSPWDFDLGMSSTKVDQFANYGFQCASCISNGRRLRTLRSNCGLCHVFLNWLIKWYIPFACLRPWWHYTTLLDTAVKVTTWGFWAKKLPEGPMLYFVMQTLFQLLAQKFYFTWSNPWSGLRSDPRSNLWFNPVQSWFCWCHKLKVILGRFRTF